MRIVESAAQTPPRPAPGQPGQSSAEPGVVGEPAADGADEQTADAIPAVEGEPGPLHPPAAPSASAEAAATPAELVGFARVRRRFAAYLALTKPRIIELLLVTTIPTMILAERGMPSLWLIAATLIGGSAAAGSANTLNCYLDRDIDQLMARTRTRPLVTGEITPRQALVFGTTLGVFSIAWFAVLVNPVAAWLTLGAILLYVVGYTMILKRRTPQNIVWGGSAGCMPVLIGWSAVTGGLDWAALVLFGIIFLWTPPHYWPLSMKFKRDYAAANVPMLPVVSEDNRVARQMLLYAAAMVACSLALIPVADMGLLYAGTAVLAGGWFMWLCVMLYRRADHRAPGKLGAMTVFHGSITYLTLVFLAVAIDPFLPF